MELSSAQWDHTVLWDSEVFPSLGQGHVVGEQEAEFLDFPSSCHHLVQR
ncbi:hypothetical protein GBAR_LOCUS16155, partial [Geodia barretti]